MTNTTIPTKLNITAETLHLASGQRVAVEGKYLGKGMFAFSLCRLTTPQAEGKTFDEIYFTTASGSFYRICRRPIIRGNWVLQGKRIGATRLDHNLLPFDLNHGFIEVGKSFNFGVDHTTNVVAILAVDTNHAFTIEHLLRHSDATSDIRATFDQFEQRWG